MCPSVLLMIITLDGKQEWHGHWTEPRKEIHHRLKFSIQQYIGCINGGRAPETKVIVLIYPVLVILTWPTAPIFSSFQSLSHVWLFVTPWTTARQAALSITNCRSLLKLMSIESVKTSNHLILCHPLLLLPSTFPSIRIFSNESAFHIRWPKCWSFSFSISSSNEYSGMISFRMDWLDLLAVQGTLKSLLQHHSSVLSFLYSPTPPSGYDYWKNHSLD